MATEEVPFVRNPLPPRLGAGVVLAGVAVLTGCGGDHTDAGRSGRLPVSTGVITPDGITDPSTARHVEASASPGTAVLLQDRTYSYTPAGSVHRRPYQPLDPARPAITVTVGTTVELRLDAALFVRPASSDAQVLAPAGAAWATTAARARFRAATAGTSELSARVHPCPDAEVACVSPYRVTVRVTPAR